MVDGEWRTRGHGWVSDGGDLWEVLERLDAAGCTRFVVTDVSKDGTLQGPNIELLREVAAATSRSSSILGPWSVPSFDTSVTTKRVQPAASRRSSTSQRSPPSDTQP